MLFKRTILLFNTFVLCSQISLFAEGFSGVSSSLGTSSSQPSSTTISRREPIAPLETLPSNQKEDVRRAPSAGYRPRSVVKSVANYFHPGVLIFKDNAWMGGDYLYNLTNHIAIYISILAPANNTLNITESVLKRRVEELFVQGGIDPVTLVEEGKPALPFFHIQILLYPFGQGYAASCKAALYESVGLKRPNLELGTAFQAITWERESLIVAPAGSIVDQLETSVMETTHAFIERVQYYKQLKTPHDISE